MIIPSSLDWWILTVAHLVGGDRAVAEDLNQETWLEALDGIDQCDATRGSFRNWLFGIARKRVALHYRRRALAGNATSFSDQSGESAELGDIYVLPEDVLEQVLQGGLGAPVGTGPVVHDAAAAVAVPVHDLAIARADVFGDE